VSFSFILIAQYSHNFFRFVSADRLIRLHSVIGSPITLQEDEEENLFDNDSISSESVCEAIGICWVGACHETGGEAVGYPRGNIESLSENPNRFERVIDDELEHLLDTSVAIPAEYDPFAD
jgi:hypothetical protein